MARFLGAVVNFWHGIQTSETKAAANSVMLANLQKPRVVASHPAGKAVPNPRVQPLPPVQANMQP